MAREFIISLINDGYTSYEKVEIKDESWIVPFELGKKEVHVIEKSAYNSLMEQANKLESLIDWLKDGIQHFTSEEDRGQAQHLCDHIDTELADFQKFKGGQE